MFCRIALAAFVALAVMPGARAEEVIRDLNVGPAVTIEAPATYTAGVAFAVKGFAYTQVGLPVIFETAQPMPNHRVDLVVDDALVTYTWSATDGSYAFDWQFGFEAPMTRKVRTVVYGDTAATTSSRTIVMSIDRNFTQLRIDPASASLAQDSTLALGAFAFDEDGRAADVTGVASWSSSDPGVATVGDGVVTGVAQGTATITASYAGMTATSVIEVQ